MITAELIKTLEQTQDPKVQFQACADAGLLATALPKNVGGTGQGFGVFCQQQEQLGYQTQNPGLLLSLHAHLWGTVFPLLTFGTAEQQTLLSALIQGKHIAGQAITEPDAGSDTGALATTADTTDNGFILNGRKRYITNPPIADMMMVYAQCQGRLSAFLVQRDDPGVTFNGEHTVASFQQAPMGEVILENVHLTSDRLVGKIGAGSVIMQAALELERAFVFAGIIGIMRWQLEQVIQHVRQRKLQTGALSNNSVIQHRIADMRCRLDTSRLWVQHCADLKDQGKRISMASAQTKMLAAEAFLASSLDAVQLLGSQGLEANQTMAQLVQDAMGSRLFSGSSEVQRNIIAALSGVQ